MMRHHKRLLSAMKKCTSHAFRGSFSTNSCCEGNPTTLDGRHHRDRTLRCNKRVQPKNKYYFTSLLLLKEAFDAEIEGFYAL